MNVGAFLAEAEGTTREAAAPSSPAWPTPRWPVRIVDEEPRGGITAVADTWALSRLAPGQTKTFTW